MPCTSGESGRRNLVFEGSSERSNRRKSKELRNTVGFPELTQATTMNLRSSGRTGAAKLHSDTSETTPTRALRIQNVEAVHTKNVLVLYTAEETLSLFSEAHLTKNRYIKFRSQAKMKNCAFYPSFHVVKAVKEEWYRSKRKIHNYKSLVEVYLQVLVDRTASRIIMAQKMPEILFWTTFLKDSVSFRNGFAMEALETANKKQRSLEDASDSDIFVTSVVPLKMYSRKTSGDKFILWHNPTPSERYCLPMRIQFKKETDEVAKEGTSVFEERINKLEKTVINFEEQYSVTFVTHNMVLTVIDGEICIAITSTSSAKVFNVCCLRQS
jgi:hypothetical protein